MTDTSAPEALTPDAAADALAGPIGDLGGRFMLDPAVFARAGEIGMAPGYAMYFAGRFGVLGPVHHDVVAGAAVFWDPGLVAREWATAREVDLPAAAAGYAGMCADWGREHLAGVDEADLRRFAELAERVIDGASPVGAPVFAGWRALPRPDDPAGRAYLCAHLLRELRFGYHGACVVASGLAPLVAVLALAGGEGTAAMFGWSEPWPEIDEACRGERDDVERRTTMLSAMTLEVLTPEERGELVALARLLRDGAT